MGSLSTEVPMIIIVAFKFVGLYSEYGFDKRLTMIEADFPGANILLHKIARLPQVNHFRESHKLAAT